MKKTIIGIVAILAITTSLFANENDFNAYGEGFYIKVESTAFTSEKLDSEFNLVVQDYTKSAGKHEIALELGMEADIDKVNNIYVDVGLAYKNKGSANGLNFTTDVGMKNGSWRYFIGGYFGGGKDKLKIDSFIATKSSSSARIDLDDSPWFLNYGAHTGVAYVLNKHWTVSTKLQLDAKRYYSVNFDANQISGSSAIGGLDLLGAAEGDFTVNSTNLIFGIKYTF